MGALDQLPLEVFENVAQHFSAEDLESATAVSTNIRFLSSSLLAEHEKIREVSRRLACTGTQTQLLLQILDFPQRAHFVSLLQVKGRHDIIGTRDEVSRDHDERQVIQQHVLSSYQDPELVCPRDPQRKGPCSTLLLLDLLPDLKHLIISNAESCELNRIYRHCFTDRLRHAAGNTQFKHKPKKDIALRKLKHLEILADEFDFGRLSTTDILPFACIPSLSSMHVYGLAEGPPHRPNPFHPKTSSVRKLSLEGLELDLGALARFLEHFPKLERLDSEDAVRLSLD